MSDNLKGKDALNWFQRETSAQFSNNVAAGVVGGLIVAGLDFAWKIAQELFGSLTATTNWWAVAFGLVLFVGMAAALGYITKKMATSKNLKNIDFVLWFTICAVLGIASFVLVSVGITSK
ncbi:glucan phosphoethanolaminetransferase (alkaline phosphatase superfamily) [Arthrobacter sp. UYCu511]|uniref:hypothetical protein n=1 Tax=Arthrobacter sp. UYCu511 TaxID=3156337 RepID=UPI003399CC37